MRENIKDTLLVLINFIVMFSFGYYFHPILLSFMGNPFIYIISIAAVIVSFIALFKHLKLKRFQRWNKENSENLEEAQRELWVLKKKSKGQKK